MNYPVDLFYTIPGSLSDAVKTQYAYSSIMQAFGKLLVGYASSNTYTVSTVSTYTSWDMMNINWAEGPAVQSGLESLFQNLTLSLLSNDDFM